MVDIATPPWTRVHNKLSTKCKINSLAHVTYKSSQELVLRLRASRKQIEIWSVVFYGERKTGELVVKPAPGVRTKTNLAFVRLCNRTWRREVSSL